MQFQGFPKSKELFCYFEESNIGIRDARVDHLGKIFPKFETEKIGYNIGL
jgi:hypothetical protein